jgi:hypothetical protein
VERIFEAVDPVEITVKLLTKCKSEKVQGMVLLRLFTNRQRLFLFGKLSGLNDKDAALAAGYSLSVAENTKQRVIHRSTEGETAAWRLSLRETRFSRCMSRGR